MFSWAVEEELVPGSIMHALREVKGLRRGKTDARETEPVKPVPDENVDAVRQHVSPCCRVDVLAVPICRASLAIVIWPPGGQIVRRCPTGGNRTESTVHGCSPPNSP